MTGLCMSVENQRQDFPPASHKAFGNPVNFKMERDFHITTRIRAQRASGDGNVQKSDFKWTAGGDGDFYTFPQPTASSFFYKSTAQNSIRLNL